MKRAFALLLSSLCLVSMVSCGVTDSVKNRKASKWERLKVSARKSLPVRTTAYTHSESDHLIYGNKTAIGTRLKYYSGVRSAAADWSKFPVGTRFQIVGVPGVTYEIDDYGSALVGTETIDLYKPSRQHMNDWGARHVEIKVIKWGSFLRSKEILKDRTKFSHVRKMYEAIKGRTGSA